MQKQLDTIKGSINRFKNIPNIKGKSSKHQTQEEMNYNWIMTKTGNLDGYNIIIKSNN